LPSDQNPGKTRTEKYAFTHVFNSLKEDLSETQVKDRIPMRDLPEKTGTEDKSKEGSGVKRQGQ
jgi:hypothetical protein